MTSSLEEKKELLTLKSLEDQLVTALMKKDSRDLSKRFFEKCVIDKEVQEKFSSLDHVHLQEELKVRYLVQHFYNAVKDNNQVYHSFIDVLTEVDEGVVSELNKELHQHELLEVLEDSQVGTSEALVGSKRPRARIGEVGLCESDVPLLTKLLADGADRAEELGVALCLTKTQIKDCKKDCSLNISLSNVILEWIRSSKMYCTLDNLKTALESHLVNLYSLAATLQEKFIDSVKNNVFKKPCPDIRFQPKYRSGDITIARGKSALLGFQVTSVHPVQYEWRKNGHLLSDSCIYSGTTKSFLFINSADNNVQGQYECRVTDGQQQHTEQMHLSLYQTDSEFKKYFSNVYKVKKDVPENSWLPSSDKVINLAIISKGKTGRDDFAYAVQGDMDDILKGKEKVEYEEVFGLYESGSLLLVEGRPGSGKTTLMHKVSKDWALDKGILKEAEIVVLVPIRLLVSANRSIDLADLFKNYIYNDKERVRVLDRYEKLGGEGVCFIIDGLDEYEHVKDYDTIILKLITKTMWPLTMIIVASRPVGTASLRNKGPNITKRIEVLGFKTDQISEYVHSYFRGNNEKAGMMMSYLETHINVYRMCYLPVHAAMICFLYDKKGDKIPQTESKIYEAFTLFSIVRKSEKEQRISMSLKALTGSDREYFLNICKLAFDMIVQSKQVMLQSQTNFPLTPIGSDISSLGLVTIDSTAELFSLEDVYSFLHLTFQEYLAAFYLSQLDSESEVIRKTNGLKVNLRMVWKFYSSIVQFDKDSLLLKSLMSDSKTDMLYKVQCAFESQQQIACDMLFVLSEEPNTLCFSNNNFIPTDFLAMRYVIETSHNQVTKLSFQNCSLDSEGVDLFLNKVSKGKLENIRFIGLGKKKCTVSEFKLFFKILCKIQHSIETLELESVDIYRPSIVKLFNGIEFSNLCTIKISHYSSRNVIPAAGAAVLTECLKSCTNLQTLHFNNLGSDGATALAEGLKSCTNLQTLDLCSNNIGSDGAVALAQGLKSCTNLQTLDLCSNNIGSDGATALAEGLNSCTNLQTLDLGINDIGSDGATALAESLKSCTNLQALHLRSNNIGSDGATALAESLKSCANLQNLNLRSNNIGSDGATALTEGLKSCTNLRTLDLDSNNIGSDGATALAEGLKSCTKLQTLDLGYNNIDSDGAIALAEGLKSYTNLQTLDLGINNIGSDGTTDLAESLKSSTNLQTLDPGCNNIGSDGASAIAEGQKSCSKLQILNLRSNNIGSDGATALAEGLKSCTNLQNLNLRSNNIGSGGATALTEGLKSCTNLQTLDLSSNNIGSDGATALAEGLKSCTNLQNLNLRSNNIGSGGATALTEGLKSCTNLQTLDLSSNNIGSDGATALPEVLKRCTNLQTLDLHSNSIGSDYATVLVERLKKSCTKLQTLYLHYKNEM